MVSAEAGTGQGRWLRARGRGTGRAGSSRQRAQRGARSGAGGHEAGPTCPRVCVSECACSSEIFEGPQLKDSTLPFPFTISM